jgi:glycosyltransferase involved in cell wall biosynthesis
VDISVLMATYRRANLLGRTLAAMAELDAVGIAWELVVVDNAGDAATEKTCQLFSGRLPLRYLVCTTRGKNAALNRGLPTLRGNLVVLTDDDVLPDANWLQQMVGGAARWPGYALFGGRVLPEWPAEPPPFDLDPDFGRWTYTICDLELSEGPSASFVPVGPNMAVRRHVFQKGIAFDANIGPNGRSYAMGSETELVLRLQRLGHHAVYLPAALVRHLIQPDQLTHAWLVGRAFRQGRAETRLAADVSWLHLARLAKHAIRATAGCYFRTLAPGPSGAFRPRIKCSLTRGRLYEAVRIKLGVF